MKVLKSDSSSTLTTTAHFALEPDSLALTSLFPSTRRVARFRGLGNDPWELTAQDEDSVSYDSSRWHVTIRGDSVVELRSKRPLKVKLQLEFDCLYQHVDGGHALYLDDLGGCGVYDVDECVRHCGSTWEMGPGQEIWIAAYPTRPPSRERLAQLIAHEGRPGSPLPSIDSIQEASQHCQILALHAYFWRGLPFSQRPLFSRYSLRSSSWMTPFHEPEDPETFQAVLDEAHLSGMKVVVYLSPYYSRAPDIVAEAERLLETYAIDGFYLDGVSSSIREMDALVRRFRERVGWERILYLNATAQPIRSSRLTCPFIDAHADFVLRGGTGREGLDLEAFLRFTVSGWQISGAVGQWCDYGSRPWGHVAELFSRFISGAPRSHHLRLATKNHVRLWRRSSWGQRGLKAFDLVYAPLSKETLARELAFLDRSSRNSGIS